MMVGTCDVRQRREDVRQAHESRGRRQDRNARDERAVLHGALVVRRASRRPTSREIIVSVLLGNPENWHLRGHEAARRMIDRAIRRAPDRERRSREAPAMPRR